MLALGLDGFTPLHIAAQFNNIKALKILLEVEGVSAWIRDLQGRTPLHIAAGRGHEEACVFLRQRMANEGQGKQDPVGEHAPIDLAGSTPAGYASIVTKGMEITLVYLLVSVLLCVCSSCVSMLLSIPMLLCGNSSFVTTCIYLCVCLCLTCHL